MNDALAELRDLLHEKDDEFRRLDEEHRRHEARLADLQSRSYLSDEEKREEVELKKRKLFLKDRMAEIARQHQESSRQP